MRLTLSAPRVAISGLMASRASSTPGSPPELAGVRERPATGRAVGAGPLGSEPPWRCYRRLFSALNCCGLMSSPYFSLM